VKQSMDLWSVLPRVRDYYLPGLAIDCSHETDGRIATVSDVICTEDLENYRYAQRMGNVAEW
jgi:hypothetical protein